MSRLTEQKGLHLVLDGLDALLAQGGQLALLGSGDAWLEAAFRQRAAAAPQAVSVTLGYRRTARAPAFRRRRRDAGTLASSSPAA